MPLILSDINMTKYATTVKHLSSGDLSDMILPIPPIEEQEAIAGFPMIRYFPEPVNAGGFIMWICFKFGGHRDLIFLERLKVSLKMHLNCVRNILSTSVMIR